MGSQKLVNYQGTSKQQNKNRKYLKYVDEVLGVTCANIMQQRRFVQCRQVHQVLYFPEAFFGEGQHTILRQCQFFLDEDETPSSDDYIGRRYSHGDQFLHRILRNSRHRPVTRESTKFQAIK